MESTAEGPRGAAGTAITGGELLFWRVLWLHREKLLYTLRAWR